MTQEPLSSKLKGTVEVDETYIGPKERGIGAGIPGPRSKKTPVVAMVERSLVKGEGRVRSAAMERLTVENLQEVINEYIEAGTALNTDEATVYYFIDRGGPHDRVKHKAKEYSKVIDGRKVTTNTVEDYFSLLKRGVHGVYHHVSRGHLHRYLSEFDFRYNARKVPDGERASLALQGTDGKRLTYRDSCRKAS